MRKAVSAGGIIVNGDRLLLINHHSHPGYSFVKGHVEPGETVEQTALREMREEAAINARIISYLGTFTRLSTERSGERVEKDIVLYLMAEVSMIDRKPEEDIVWVEYSEAVLGMAYPVETQFLRAHRTVLLGVN